MTALVSAVTEAEASVYDRSAHLLGLNPWDFSLEIEWAENDEGDRDIHPLRFDVLKVKRAPVRGLTKDKRLPIWQGIVESLPGGSDGCKIEDDDVTGTAVVRYGKPLALPKDVRTIDLLPKYVDPMGWAKVTYGVGVDGRPIAIDLSKVPHVLIAGKPGSGKSTLLRTDTAVRLANGHKVVVLDHAKKAPWAVAFKPYTILWCTENRAIANALAFIYEESRRRGKLIREHGLENWYDFTLEERERFNIYPLSIYFDEYESAIDPKDLKTTELAYGKDSARYTADQRFNAAVGKIMTYMEQIGKEARYAGIFLVVSTQFPYANKLAGSRNVLGNTIQLAAPGTALQSSEIGLAMGSDTAETIELLTKYSRVRTGEKPPVGLSVIRDSENGTLAAMKIAYLEPADVVSTMKTLGVQECQPWRITDELGVGLRAEETPDPRQPIAPPVLKLTHLDEEAEDVIDLYSSQAASPAEQDSIDSDMDADQETADDPDAESGAPQHEAAEAPIGTAEPEAVLDAPVKSRWSRFQ
jgi:energy-coupling factor transporter ATP-binding protein EcfA2